MEGYDWIGLDTDCIFQFTSQFKQLFIKTILTDLHENFNGYGAKCVIEIADHESDLGMGTIWDIKNGALLKVDGQLGMEEFPDLTVREAYVGQQKLTENEIIALYGPAKACKINYPETKRQIMEGKDDDFWVFTTEYDSFLIPLVQHLVHLVKQGEL